MRFPSDGQCLLFQSTLPVWGATFCSRLLKPEPKISIHAPRVGSDKQMINNADIVLHFNPRSPCGERREMDGLPIYVTTFQSTLPVWGATRAGLLKNRGYDISIHAPRVGSDKGFGFFDAEVGISIHAPRVGSDLFIRDQLRLTIHFNPRSPCGERRLCSA